MQVKSLWYSDIEILGTLFHIEVGCIMLYEAPEGTVTAIFFVHIMIRIKSLGRRISRDL